MANPPLFLVIPGPPGYPLFVDLQTKMAYIGVDGYPLGGKGLRCYVQSSHPELCVVGQICPGELLPADPSRAPLPHNHTTPIPDSTYLSYVFDYAIRNAFAAFKEGGISTEQFLLVYNYYAALFSKPLIVGYDDEEIPAQFIIAGQTGTPYPPDGEGSLTFQNPHVHRISSIRSLIEFNAHHINRWYGPLLRILDPPYVPDYELPLNAVVPNRNHQFFAVRTPPGMYCLFISSLSLSADNV